MSHDDTPLPSEHTPRQVTMLGPPRHTCHACGKCCSGWVVRLADDGEVERLLRQAAELGVPDPVRGRELRQENASCIFLGEDKLCRIHARYGESEKPLACQLFPRRSVRAEDGVRFGVDPGCSSTWRSYEHGPLISMWYIPTERDEHLPPEAALTERRLIAVARAPGMTVARFLGRLSGEPVPASGELPVGITTRLFERVRTIAELLDAPINGPSMRADLAPVVALLRAPDTRPPVAVPPELDALALETLRRTLFLRINGDKVTPVGCALHVLGGVIACALAHQQIESFGPALAAWSRVMRFDGMWDALVPDEDVVYGIVHGEVPEEDAAGDVS
jgi:Fe-S-cluster containining protein